MSMSFSRTSSRMFAAVTAVALTAIAGAADAGATPTMTPNTAASPRITAGHAVTAAASKAPKSRNATYATALSGYIPCPFNTDYPEIGCGHMRNGRVKPFKGAFNGSHVNIKNIDGAWKRTSVRFVDVAGDRNKEAVVIISASAGGVGWPNDVLVYDGNGRLLNRWNSGVVTNAEPREGTSFGGGPAAPASTSSSTVFSAAARARAAAPPATPTA